MTEVENFAAFMEALAQLGFGSDEPISGADTVDVINEHLPALQALKAQLTQGAAK